MTKTLHSLAAITALALAGAAIADDTTLGLPATPAVGVGANANLSLKSVDANKDGKVSKDEAAGNPQLADQFDKLDANHDGNLNQAEFAKFEGSAKGDAKASGKKPSDKSDTTKPAQ